MVERLRRSLNLQEVVLVLALYTRAALAPSCSSNLRPQINIVIYIVIIEVAMGLFSLPTIGTRLEEYSLLALHHSVVLFCPLFAHMHARGNRCINADCLQRLRHWFSENESLSTACTVSDQTFCLYKTLKGNYIECFGACTH